jgi:gliding motility-associated-like protein
MSVSTFIHEKILNWSPWEELDYYMNSYQWFKDGDIIDDATSQMYETSESGTYSVQVDLGDCMADGEIVLESELFEGSINIPEINTIDEGETVSVIVTNDANAPEFEWFFNDTLITDATEDNYEASEIGSYKVIVTETSGCIGALEFEFVLKEAFPEVEKIPNIISPNGDGINDTWVIPQSYVSGTNTEVKIMTNRGRIVLQTNNYLNNWPENDLNLTSVNQIFYYVITTNNDTKKGSITVLK